MRRALFAAALLAVVTPALAAGTHAAKPADKNVRKDESVALALDEVHTLTFRTPVSTLYVGNPSIADVTMIDAKHAFVQGKGYGRTNIMALNRDNVMVFNTHVSVTGQAGGGTVTLNRGSERVTLNCAGGRCEQTPTPGDGKAAFGDASSQAAAHYSTARGVALAEGKN